MSTKKQAPVLIPAVAYCRKSTKGKRTDGGERQEKSIDQQKAEIKKLAAGRFEIVQWFEDEGVSGWKRNGKRPDFARMLGGVKERGAQAVICDNIDRFSRAAPDEVQEDANALRKAGCRWIVTVSHGEYDLGARYDIGTILKFVVAAWSASEYSRQLGRRIALARRNAAIEGRRTGGPAAYGYKRDGKSLKPGDVQQVKTLKWIFEEYAKGVSLNRISEQLNKVRKVPAPKGAAWYPKSIKCLLQNPVYAGRFAYGRTRSGQFYTTDEQGEIVERSEANGTGKVFTKDQTHPALIDKATFDKVQQRIARESKTRESRKREYALSGVLYCGHCGGRLTGTRHHDHVIYRCSSAWSKGRGQCPTRQVREDEILPALVKVLTEEIADLKQLLSRPPEELMRPNKGRASQRKQLEKDRAKLEGKIGNAIESLFDISDKATRREVDKRITQMREELVNIDAELATEPLADGYSRADLDALKDWWTRFAEQAVSVPYSWTMGWDPAMAIIDGQEPGELTLILDPLAINEALRELGAKVTIRWESRKVKERHRYTVADNGVRFQLGQREGDLRGYVSEPSACRSSGRNS